MKFGLRNTSFVYPNGTDKIWEDTKTHIQRAEHDGFHSFWVINHFALVTKLNRPIQFVRIHPAHTASKRDLPNATSRRPDCDPQRRKGSHSGRCPPASHAWQSRRFAYHHRAGVLACDS